MESVGVVVKMKSERMLVIQELRVSMAQLLKNRFTNGLRNPCYPSGNRTIKNESSEKIMSKSTRPKPALVELRHQLKASAVDPQGQSTGHLVTGWGAHAAGLQKQRIRCKITPTLSSIVRQSRLDISSGHFDTRRHLVAPLVHLVVSRASRGLSRNGISGGDDRP